MSPAGPTLLANDGFSTIDLALPDAANAPWYMPVVDGVAFADLAPLDIRYALEWRTEVMDQGQRYIFRKGSGAARQSHPGGRFDQLSDERKTDYERNKRKLARARKAKAKKRRQDAANPEPSRRAQRATDGPGRLPAGRDRAGPSPGSGGVTPAA